MAGGAPGGGGQGMDPEWTIVLVLIVTFMVLGGMWAAWHTGVAHAVIWSTWAELTLVKIVTIGLYKIGLLGDGFMMELDKQIAKYAAYASVPSSKLSFEQVMDAAAIAGYYMRWPVSLMLCLMGFYLIMFHPASKYKRAFNLPGLMAEQARAWPAIAPTVKSDPLLDKAGQWREAMSPEEWLKEHKIEIIESSPDREGTRNALARQLARGWSGAGAMQPHLRALCAAFALKSKRKNEECRDLLASLSNAWVKYGSVTRGMTKDAGLRRQVDKVLADPELGGQLFAQARRHAYVESAMATMLLYARKRGGVLASAEFLWLRPEDRAMWYILNNVGRLTFHPECAGAMAHWLAETAAGRPLPEPDVDEAVFGFEEVLMRGRAA